MFNLKHPISIRLQRWMAVVLALGVFSFVPVAQQSFLPNAYAADGLNIYFKPSKNANGTTNYSPPNASSRTEFTTDTCGTATGNLNYTGDSGFPSGCSSSRDYFLGYATGWFKAPITGDITFYMNSDDSSNLVITVNGTEQVMTLSDCCRTISQKFTGFVAGNYYPLKSYFTEIGGAAYWIMSYSWTAQNGYSAIGQTVVPATALSSSATYSVSFDNNLASSGAPSASSATQGSFGGSVTLATD